MGYCGAKDVQPPPPPSRVKEVQPPSRVKDIQPPSRVKEVQPPGEVKDIQPPPRQSEGPAPSPPAGWRSSPPPPGMVKEVQPPPPQPPGMVKEVQPPPRHGEGGPAPPPPGRVKVQPPTPAEWRSSPPPPPPPPPVGWSSFTWFVFVARGKGSKGFDVGHQVLAPGHVHDARLGLAPQSERMALLLRSKHDRDSCQPKETLGEFTIQLHGQN